LTFSLWLISPQLAGNDSVDTSGALDALEVSGAPEAPETSGVPDAPDVPEAPEASGVSDESGIFPWSKRPSFLRG
jgi:hypothetical protein